MKIIKSEEMNKHKITKVISRDYAGKLFKMKKIILENPNQMLNKPQGGFWLSVNDGWEKWCKSENFLDIDNSVIVDIIFSHNHNIMVIDDVPDIINIWTEFLKETGFQSMYPSGTNLTCFISKSGDVCNFWSWLINKYKLSGIYLTDEGQWRTRMTTMMYGWDCESCVIFNENLIQKMIEVKDGK